MTKKKLRLRAENEEDLAIISACLQDAVVRNGDLAYFPKRRSFVGLFSRFKWEDETSGKGSKRVLAGLHIQSVLDVRSQNIPREDDSRILELLTITYEKRDELEGEITLVFADGGLIRIHVECLDCYLRDFGSPWMARRRPWHSVLENGK